MCLFMANSVLSRVLRLTSSNPLKAIEIGLEALECLGFSIPLDAAAALAVGEDLRSKTSTDPAIIAVLYCSMISLT
jgi:hypothetical protein